MDATRLFVGVLLVTGGVAGGLLAVRAIRRYRALEERKLSALDRVIHSQERLVGVMTPLRVVNR